MVDLQLFPTSLDTCAFSPPPLVYVFIAPLLFLPLLNKVQIEKQLKHPVYPRIMEECAETAEELGVDHLSSSFPTEVGVVQRVVLV